MEIPPQWPPQVIELYDPLLELGQGGFASVVLARCRKDPRQVHAIKVVGSKVSTRQEMGYARREIDILSELAHPGIMRLLGHWESPVESHTCVAVMALSYAPGPTLEQLLRYGRLGLTFSRVVVAQLVDAMAYLHGRAVVHRDCKPDNLIVTGASFDQDDIWNDDTDTTKTEASSTDEANFTGSGNSTAKEWRALGQRWHVTLVDFGFARALTPEDLNKPPPTPTPTRTSSKSVARSRLDASTRSTRSLNRSISHQFGRRMSALGTRTFVAPEVVRCIQNRPLPNSSRHAIDITDTLSENVSYYGLMADAYSVGSTIKYMLTGVLPTENVNDAIAVQNNPWAVLCRFLCNGGASSKGKRPVQYRTLSAIPKEVLRLVQGLTHPDPQQRTTIRQARAYPWIDDVLVADAINDDDDNKPPMVDRREIDFLSFARGEAAADGPPYNKDAATRVDTYLAAQH